MDDHLDWVGASLFPRQARDEMKDPGFKGQIQPVKTDEAVKKELAEKDVRRNRVLRVGINEEAWNVLPEVEKVLLVKLLDKTAYKLEDGFEVPLDIALTQLLEPGYQTGLQKDLKRHEKGGAYDSPEYNGIKEKAKARIKTQEAIDEKTVNMLSPHPTIRDAFKSDAAAKLKEYISKGIDQAHNKDKASAPLFREHKKKRDELFDALLKAEKDLKKGNPKQIPKI